MTRIITALLVVVLAASLSAGTAHAQGSRNDRDGDGVPNAEDRCPDVAGPASNYGCPADRDGDGLDDSADQCPDQAGPRENGGCPVAQSDPTPAPPPEPAPGTTDNNADVLVPTVPPPLPELATSGDCVIASGSWDNVIIRAVPTTAAPVEGALAPTDTLPVLGELVIEGETWRWVENGWIAAWVTRLGGDCDFTPPVVPDDADNGLPASIPLDRTFQDNVILETPGDNFAGLLNTADLLAGICPNGPVVVVIGDAYAPNPDIVVAGPDYVGTDCDEEIHGDDRPNLILGGGGNDDIEGGDGDDTLIGGEGDDQLAGRNGNDLLIGGPGNDRLFGGDGHDRLYGNAGDDRLSGLNGNDELWGGSGNDYLEGRNGDDVIAGGAGDDQIFGDYETDFASTNPGPDNDWLSGGPGADRIVGGPGADEIYGGAGEDVIIGGLGADLLYGGDDDDAIYAGPHNDLVYGDEEDDFIDGAQGYDFVFGNAGIDKCVFSEIAVCDAVE